MFNYTGCDASPCLFPICRRSTHPSVMLFPAYLNALHILYRDYGLEPCAPIPRRVRPTSLLPKPHLVLPLILRSKLPGKAQTAAMNGKPFLPAPATLPATASSPWQTPCASVSIWRTARHNTMATNRNNHATRASAVAGTKRAGCPLLPFPPPICC